MTKVGRGRNGGIEQRVIVVHAADTKRTRRSAIPYAALSAGIAISLSTAGQSASAQEATAQRGSSRVLYTIEVTSPRVQQRRATAPAASAPRQAQPRRTPRVAAEPVGVPSQGGPQGYVVPTASSPKQTAPLLDTPQTVTVVPQQIIREQGARNLTEVLRNTPGISFDAGENGFSTSTNNFKLRGFDGSGNIFFDGARDSGTYTRDTFNVDRVEVFKGPAMENGRGGAGGYVNLVSKVPWLANVTQGDVSFGFAQGGQQAQKRGTIDMNYIVAPNTAFRLNAMIEQSGIPGRDVAENRTWGIAPSLAFGLGTDLRAYVSYEHLTRRDRPDWGIPGAGVKGMFRYDPLAASASKDNFYGLRSDFDNVDSDAVLGRVEYDITKHVTISNQTRWSTVDRSSQYTVPTGFTPATRVVSTQRQFYDRRNTSVSNLTNVSASFDTGQLQHKVSAGLEFTQEESNALRFGTQNSNTDLFNPNPDRAIAAPLLPTFTNGIKINTVAAYVFDTIKLNEQWSIMGGLRAEKYKVDIDSRTIAGLPSGLNGSESDVTLGGKTAIVYKPTRYSSIYGAFGVSYLPPGSYLSNPDISRPDDNAFPGFVAGADPTRFHNYEVGTKVDFFGGRLSTTAAIFRTEKRNAPITGRDVGDTVDSLKGYGQQIVQGIEFGAAGQITPAWSVFGGLLFMQSERKHSAYLDDVRRRANPADYAPFLTTSGNELAFTPNVSGNLWTTYKFISTGWTLGAGVNFASESFLGRPDDANRIIPNGQFGMLPGYAAFNLMASYDIQKDVVLRLNVDNVADNRYAVSSNWNGSRAAIAAGRVYRVSTSFKF
ncbi:TonB-dependent receptor [Tardiphaga alba]|uniref:TonB-dependent receptor n=1 Tax=Tardiphaga alba TaxID=340268 RepID=A0ABX8A9B5_9BRAD|nr:TonB-dependent receptor [Tardiphaga alba]QUS40194.1 TonB-dependent receptor [Tardiphaga alba]